MTDLIARMATLSTSLTVTEKASYKMLLALASGGFLRAEDKAAENDALNVSVSLLANLREAHHVPPNGVAWKGRPHFITDDLLQRLQIESATLRSSASRVEDHRVVHGGKIAQELAFSDMLLAFVREHAGNVVSTERASYLYYDEVGMGIDPHIDNEEFALNTILMLDHQHSGDPSMLALYPSNSPPHRFQLLPGELIIFFAGNVVHARERMKHAETVRVVSFGFQPI